MSMRRSQTLKNNRSSMPGGNPIARLGAVDDLGVLSEERITSIRGMDNIEAELRSVIFEKERANDKLQDQIVSLQNQLSQRPPLTTIQEIENEKRALELILQGTQRENEKMMIQLERGQSRQKLLENELRRLCGENWQVSLNIPPAESPNLHSSQALGGPSSFIGNPNFSSSTLSLNPPPSIAPSTSSNAKRKSMMGNILPRSLIGRTTSPIKESEDRSRRSGSSTPNVDSSYMTAADQTRAARGDDDNSISDEDDEDDDSAEVEEALQEEEEGPTRRELELEKQNALLKHQVEQVKLLVLGLDKRLVEREEKLGKVVSKAERENRGLDVRLRELNANAA